MPGPTIVGHDQGYGNVLLSRLPVRECARTELAHRGGEPRDLIDVRLDMSRRLAHRGQSLPMLRCIATHLGLSRVERRAQIADIAARIAPATDKSDCPEPLVLLGDFNEWCRHNRRLSPLDRLLQPAPGFATFPARWPLLALDRIWYQGYELEQCGPVRTDLTRIASDHLPLLAGFGL